MPEAGSAGVWYHDFGGYFSFWEAFRLPGDEARWPIGKAKTAAHRMDRSIACNKGRRNQYAGTVIGRTDARWTKWLSALIRNI